MKVTALASEALRFERRTDAESYYFKASKQVKEPHNYIILYSGIDFIIRLIEPQSRRTIGYIQ